MIHTHIYIYDEYMYTFKILEIYKTYFHILYILLNY
jgi:hypothetical protein